MPQLTLRLLGPPTIELDGKPVSLGRHKAMAMLAYLALSPGSHSRESLATLLWPELDQRRARAEVRRTLSLLNRTLGNAWFAVDRETAEWAPQDDAWLDVDALREDLAACAVHGHAAGEVCEACVPLLTEAVALYRDGFLAGFTLPDSAAFDEWQFFETESLRDVLAGALQRLAGWHGGQDEFEAAIPFARRWVSLDPTHEPAQRALMRLYSRSGQRSAALRQYAECERTLAQELGIAPSAETVRLNEAIREKREGLTPAPAEDAVIALPSVHLHNLPAHHTPFVGREQELSELDRLLSPSAQERLVTVLGAGGMGKTRLAQEAAAAQVARYPDGVWWVSFAPVASEEAIVPTVARAFGLSFYPGGTPRAQLLHYLREKRLLLVLDNLEHLLAGVGLLADLLRAAPGVHILGTSRTRLNLRGEQALTLGGLAYPSLRRTLRQHPELSQGQDAAHYSAVELFLRSARRARSGFALDEEGLLHVARICQLVEGMPLAILLAASWVPALTPAEIAAEVARSLDILAADWRDVPERHHSMRAVFDSTWEMLQGAEQTAFVRLSVFRGGFTREAAQAVAGSDLRVLVGLVSKSLLERDANGRFVVHELLLQTAAEKLDAQPVERDRVLDRHCAYYAELLHGKEAELWKGPLQEALNEIDNIRAAWRWATAHHKVAEIRKGMYSLSDLYQGIGLFQEGEGLFAAAVEALRARGAERLDKDQEAALGLALVRQAWFSSFLGQTEKAQRLAQEGLSILHRLGPRAEVVLGYSIAPYLIAVDHTEARQLLVNGLAISRELGHNPAVSQTLNSLAYLALRRGAYRDAEEYSRKSLRMSRCLDSRSGAAGDLAFLGHAAYGRGEYDKARRCYEESLVLYAEIGQVWTTGRLHSHLGDTALAVKDYGGAREHHQRALVCYQEVGVHWVEVAGVIGGCWGIPVSLQTLGDIALAQGDHDRARRTYRQALQRAVGQPYLALHLHLLLGPIKWLSQEGQTERAAELAALAQHHPESVEETQTKASLLLDPLRAGLAPDVFAAAEQRGSERDLDATMRELRVELGG